MFQFNYRELLVVAEIGCDHMGRTETAREPVVLEIEREPRQKLKHRALETHAAASASPTVP